MAITLEADPTLPQGYLKVNGTTAATITTSGVTGNLTGTASSLASRVKFPNYTSGVIKTYNTTYQAAEDGYLVVVAAGSYKNGIQIVVGSTSSPSTTIWYAGDDINANTKWVGSGAIPLPKDIYYGVIPIPTLDAFETISITWFPAIL